MSFQQDSGYTPLSITDLMDAVRLAINSQFGTTYTQLEFEGTNWYKYFYALMQKVSENEIKTSEIFQKLQQYITLTNERIQRPSVSHPGLIDSFDSNGYVASVRPPVVEDAGLVSICVDLDDGDPGYDDERLAVCNLIKDFIAAGMVTQGTEEETITLSNGQNFPFKFFLPNRIPVLLRLTIDESENNLLSIPGDQEIRQKVFDQINERYRLGYNFEPQRYFTQTDAPYAGDISLEWSDDAGSNWHPEVYDADFDDLFEFGLEDIEVVINLA